MLSEESTREQLRTLLNDVDRWKSLSEQEKQDVRTVMALMGFTQPTDLLLAAVREYISTIKENPDRWVFPNAMYVKH